MPANNDYTGFISSVQTPSGDLYKIRDMEVPAYFSGQNVCIEGLDPRYQRYESVYNGAQSVRIDTGVTTYNDDCEFYIRFKQTQSGVYMRLFGADTGGQEKYRIGFISLNTTSIKLCYRNATAITSTITRSKDHIYTLIGKLKNGSASLYVKDETTGETDYQTDTYNLDTSYKPEIRLFYISQGTAYMASGTHVYRAMLKVKGECKLDYVPVKSPENEVGMYDTVTQTFRSNSNSGGGSWLVGTVANDNAFIVSAQGEEVMTGATSSTNGEIGLVPQPVAGDQGKYLRGDGTWQTPAVPAGSVDWGQIGGTLSNQTDLQSALDDKYDASNPNGYTDNVGTVTSVNNTQPDSSGNVTLNIPSAYTLPIASATVLGGVKIDGNNLSIDSSTGVLSAQDTTYGVFTADSDTTPVVEGVNGLVPHPTFAEQSKFLRGDGTWQIPPDPSVMSGATSQAAGVSGLVPQPIAGDNEKFLCGDGSFKTPAVFFGRCSTSQGTKAKTVTVSSAFQLVDGAVVFVRFANSNTASSPTLNVNSTGAKAIVRYGSTSVGTATTTSWAAGTTWCLVYDGTNTRWMVVGWLNTTYSDFTGATSSDDGAHGLVPKPLAADRTKFLCGNGTWANIPTTTLTAESGIDINEYDEITSGFVRLNGRSGSYALHQCSLVACTDSMLGMTWLMEPLCTTGGTSSKVPNSNAKFPIGCQIYYHPDNTAFTANTDFATKMFYSSYESVPAAYTAVTGNSINLSNSSASSVFLRVSVNGANTHWSPYYKAGATTEIIVTSNNLVSSNFYIYLGKTNGNSQGFQLEDNHPLYYYDGSKLIDWANYIAELEASTISSQYLTIYSNGFNLALDTTISSGQQVAMTLSGSQSSLSGQFKLSSHLTLFGSGNADSRVEVRLMANPNYTNENERYYPIAATTHDVLSGHYCSIDLTDIYCRTTDGKLSVAVIVKNCGTTPVQMIGNKTDTTSQNTYPMSYLRLQRLNKYTGTIIVDNSYATTFSSNDDTLISQNT